MIILDLEYQGMPAILAQVIIQPLMLLGLFLPEAAGLLTGADNKHLLLALLEVLLDSIALKLNAEILTNKAKLLANPTVIALEGMNP